MLVPNCLLRRLGVVLTAFFMVVTACGGQTSSTWTGLGDGTSYNDSANWTSTDVPINTLVYDYLVTVGAGATVVYNVPDGPGGSNAITQFTLASDSSLTIQGRNLVVNDSASVAGRITVTSGSFVASHVSSALTGTGAILLVNTSANPADAAAITLAASGTYGATAA